MNELDGKLNMTQSNISHDGNYNSIVKTPKNEINQKQFQNNYNNPINNNSIHQIKEINNQLINQIPNIENIPNTQKQNSKSKKDNQRFNIIASENEDDKNQRKWQKIIDKTFETKIESEENNIEEKTEDKFKNDQEIKNIINELYIKQKNSQYLFNKKRQTLKNFNLQEKIQREETRIIKDNEEAKNNDIFNDAIQKLAARHMLGFEPLTVIRQKILNKIQAKYNINAENMAQLTNYFTSNVDSDKELEIKRKEKQIEVLENILSDSKKFDYKEVDKATIIKVKNEMKNYEKDLALKAAQNDNEGDLNDIEQLLLKEQEENNINEIQEEYNSSMENEYDDDLKIKITKYINIEEDKIVYMKNQKIKTKKIQKQAQKKTK